MSAFNCLLVSFFILISRLFNVFVAVYEYYYTHIKTHSNTFLFIFLDVGTHPAVGGEAQLLRHHVVVDNINSRLRTFTNHTQIALRVKVLMPAFLLLTRHAAF